MAKRTASSPVKRHVVIPWSNSPANMRDCGVQLVELLRDVQDWGAWKALAHQPQEVRRVVKLLETVPVVRQNMRKILVEEDRPDLLAVLDAVDAQKLEEA